MGQSAGGGGSLGGAGEDSSRSDEVVPLEVICLVVGMLVRLQAGEMILPEAVAVILPKVEEVVQLASIVGKSTVSGVRTQPHLYIKLPISA